MTELPELDEKVFGVKEAWLNSVDKAKRIISERFAWMSLKEVPLTEFGCVTDYEIEYFKRHVNQLFSGISMDKLQKSHVRKSQSYVSWKRKHFKEEHYALQINPPDTISKTAGTLCIRPLLQCAMKIEIPYYGSDVARVDKCYQSHCGGNNTVVSQELKQKFKTVLPMCKACLDNGKEPFPQRPYGNGQK